jgi:hypothetical protein
MILVFRTPDSPQARSAVDLLLPCQAEVSGVQLVAHVCGDKVPNGVYGLIIYDINRSSEMA